MSLKLLYKKGRPKIRKGRNRVVSAAKRKGNKHVSQRMLDQLISPVVSVTKKDYGYSTVQDDSGASTGDLPTSGILSSISCQPGRQIYLEFMGLPVTNFPGQSLLTGVTTTTYKRTWSFLELLYMSYIRNRTLVQPTMNINMNQPDDFGISDIVPTGVSAVDNTNVLSNTATVQVSSSQTLEAFIESANDMSLYDFSYKYMGGYQLHKFYNATTLPIHGEIREFRPRQVMGFDKRRRTVGATAQDTELYPGMWQTLYADLLRSHNPSPDADSTYNKVQPGLFDEIDDKGFKYTKGCEETNFRWIVGEAVKFTIYPGQTYTYKMIFPPFTGTSLSFCRQVQRWWSNIGGGSQSSHMVGLPVAVMPGFTKYAQVRFIGSRAFRYDNAKNDNPTVGTTTDGFVRNKAFPDSSGNQISPDYNGSRSITDIATHGCRLTHTVTEHHAIRSFPVFAKSIHQYTDYTSNAENKGDIAAAGQMGFIDPVENDMEIVAGEN